MCSLSLTFWAFRIKRQILPRDPCDSIWFAWRWRRNKFSFTFLALNFSDSIAFGSALVYERHIKGHMPCSSNHGRKCSNAMPNAIFGSHLLLICYKSRTKYWWRHDNTLPNPAVSQQNPLSLDMSNSPSIFQRSRMPGAIKNGPFYVNIRLSIPLFWSLSYYSALLKNPKCISGLLHVYSQSCTL